VKECLCVLVVDDFKEWREVVGESVRDEWGMVRVEEAADGLEATIQAEKHRPDLVFLDIGLPLLNGIAAARRIRTTSPRSKILFLSENRSHDIAEEALTVGDGYVLKSAAAMELLPAMRAVLKGARFMSQSIVGDSRHGFKSERARKAPSRDYSNRELIGKLL
jgi:two-component system, NarL family, response regulator NreC